MSVADLTEYRNSKGAYNPVVGLRLVADRYEAGEFGDSHVTLVIGDSIFHFGTVDDRQAVANTVWDLELGKALLMQAALR